MLNPKLKLNPKLFDKKVEKIPTRDGYGEGLLELGDTNQDVVAICADLTESTRTEAFAKKFEPSMKEEWGMVKEIIQHLWLFNPLCSFGRNLILKGSLSTFMISCYVLQIYWCVAGALIACSNTRIKSARCVWLGFLIHRRCTDSVR